jgi:hypothetical protein
MKDHRAGSLLEKGENGGKNRAWYVVALLCLFIIFAFTLVSYAEH